MHTGFADHARPAPFACPSFDVGLHVARCVSRVLTVCVVDQSLADRCTVYTCVPCFLCVLGQCLS
jgi:hypothetical protein